MEFAHIRVIGSLADGRLADMLAELTEIAGNADLILEADLLIAEEDDLIARERVVQLLDLLVGKRTGQVDGADLGADMRARRCGGDGFIGRRVGNGGNFRDLRQMRGRAHRSLPCSMRGTGFAAHPSYALMLRTYSGLRRRSPAKSGRLQNNCKNARATRPNR